MRQDAHEQLHGLPQPHLVRQNPALDVRRRRERDPRDLTGVPVHEARRLPFGARVRRAKRRPQRVRRAFVARVRSARAEPRRFGRSSRAPLLSPHHPVHRLPLVRPRVRYEPWERAGQRRCLPRRLRRLVRRARRRVARGRVRVGFPASPVAAASRRRARGEALDRVGRRTQPRAQDASQSRVLLLTARVLGKRRRVREGVGGQTDGQKARRARAAAGRRRLRRASGRRESQRALAQQREKTRQERLFGSVGVRRTRERLRRKRVAKPRPRRRFDAKRFAGRGGELVVGFFLSSRLGGARRGSTRPRPLERAVVHRGGPHERARARRPERDIVRFCDADSHALERCHDDILGSPLADGHFHGFGERRVPSPRTAFFARRGRRYRVDADALVPTRRGFPPRHRGLPDFRPTRRAMTCR